MYRYQPTRGKDGIVVDQILTAGHKLADGDIQDVHEESEVQNYSIGTRWVLDDRVFRYSYAKSALVAFKGGAADIMPREGAGDGVAYEVGATEVTIPMNAQGDDFVIEQVKDYWAEGYYWSGVSTPIIGMMHRIKSSAAASTAGQITELTTNEGYVKATLYEPIRYRIPASTWQTSWVNPYKACVPKTDTHGQRRSIICQPLRDVQAEYYFWGQTWGPCFGQRHGDPIGRQDKERTLFYHTNGAIMGGRAVNFTSGQALPQIAGYLISCTRAWTNESGGSEGGGDQFYMLTLSP